MLIDAGFSRWASGELDFPIAGFRPGKPRIIWLLKFSPAKKRAITAIPFPAPALAAVFPLDVFRLGFDVRLDFVRPLAAEPQVFVNCALVVAVIIEGGSYIGGADCGVLLRDFRRVVAQCVRPDHNVQQNAAVACSVKVAG